MTPEQVFQTVANHLLEQNAKAINEEGTCQYRDEAGRKCAVGVLIPDEVYSPDFEGTLVQELIRKHSRELPESINDNTDLLMDLQYIHDNFEPRFWADRLYALAKRWAFDVSFLKPELPVGYMFTDTLGPEEATR